MKAIHDGYRKIAPADPPSYLRRVLLACGMLSSLLYGLMLVVVPARWPGYSSAAQTVSELSAIGAPTRALWVSLAGAYVLLLSGFAAGIWLSARGGTQLRLAAAAVLASVVLNLFWPPMHLRGTPPTRTDALHIAFAMGWLLLTLATMVAAALAMERRFRRYTLGTVMVFVTFGLLTARDAPGIARDLPTPWIGVWERINIAAFMLWLVVLAAALWKDGASGPARAVSPAHGRRTLTRA